MKCSHELPFFSFFTFRGIPGMPGMEMYSQEDIAKMRDQLGVPKEEKKPQREEMLDSEGNLFHGEAVSFFQMVLDTFWSIWLWIRRMLGFRNSNSGEL